MRDKDSGKKIFWIYPTNKFVWAGVVICSIFCAFMIYFLCVANLSENKVRSAMEIMVEYGLVEASGRGKNRSYILGKKIYRENDEAIQYVRQTDIDSIRYPELVMKLAHTQNGIISKQDVTELLNVTPTQAYTIIKKLQNEGKLERICSGKYAKYRMV